MMTIMIVGIKRRNCGQVVNSCCSVYMPAMKQEATSDDIDATGLGAHRQFASPAPLCQPPPPQCLIDDSLQTPLRDVMLSRDYTTSGVSVTSDQPRDVTAPPPMSRLVDTGAAPTSSSALVSSPETGWRAVSGVVSGGLWDRKPIAPTSQSSPADAEPADTSLVAASPTVGRSPRLMTTTSDGSDPLATLMRLYGSGGGTLSQTTAGSAYNSPDHQPRHLDKQASTYCQLIQCLPLASGNIRTATSVRNLQ